MCSARRQHWVPQSYLRRFASEPGGSRIWTYDKGSGHTRLLGIRDVCQREKFYESWLGDETVKADPEARPGLIEHALGRWETALREMTRVAERVSQGGAGSLEERMNMAIAIAVQIVRTPRFRDDLLKPLESQLAADFNAHFAENRPELAARIRIDLRLRREQQSILHSRIIWSSGIVEQLAHDLYHYIWIIGINQTGVGLYTSDNPVIGWYETALRLDVSQEQNRGVTSAGLVSIMDFKADVGTTIAIPLTPQLVLLMHNPTHFKELHEKQGHAYRLSEPNVILLNAYQAKLSERHVFSPTNDFAVARAAAQPTKP